MIYTGLVPHESVPDYLAAMDVAVVPYRMTDDFFFSPLKLFECMAVGVPTVAAALGQITEVIDDGETGWLYPAGDNDALADRIWTILRSPEMARTVGLAGREKILRHHTWRRVAERIVDIAESRISARKPPADGAEAPARRPRDDGALPLRRPELALPELDSRADSARSRGLVRRSMSSVWPFDPVQDRSTSDCAYAVQHIARCMEQAGLLDRWAFRLVERKSLCECAGCLAQWSERRPFPRDACWGLSDTELDELYASCDVLLNVGGVTSLREEHLAAPMRVYVQTDPVIRELRLANGDEHTRNAFSLHHAVVTYGENYGQADCGVPLNGVAYGTTRQPIDLDLWPMAYRPTAPLFTTIGNYRQPDNDVEYPGEVYTWSKHHEWEKFLDLPRRTQQPFELALMMEHESDRRRLEAHGWRVISPYRMSLDIFGAYQDYIRGSRAEFTVAKDQNVRLRSGWFSERDACYLASGKPVVAQDTGFSTILPTGRASSPLRPWTRPSLPSRRSTRITGAIVRLPAPSPKSTSRPRPWRANCYLIWGCDGRAIGQHHHHQLQLRAVPAGRHRERASPELPRRRGDRRR